MNIYYKIAIIMGFLLTAQQSVGQNLKKQFKQEIDQCLAEVSPEEKVLIKGEDTDHLPDIVRKYLYRTEFVGKERVRNVKITFEGRIRKNPTDPWMKMTAYQLSTFEKPTRIFYMKAKKMGIPAIGLHCFKNGKASMKVKLLGLFTLVDVNGELMNRAETVTHFNDMCLMAPGTLIDKNIRWKEIDPLTVEAYYSNEGVYVLATLYFNKDGYLVNFMSNDRFDLSDPNIPKLYPFSTPIESYGEQAGVTVPVKAKTVYSRPDGDFIYGEFMIKSIEYNTNNNRFKR